MTRVSTMLSWCLPVATLALFGAGCTGSSTPQGLDGGVFRTKDSATTWEQLKVLNLGAKLGSIANVGIATLVADPQDPQTLYAGTVENGVIYSLDAGASWVPAKGLTNGRVTSIAVDPKDKCTMYASRGNQIHKTTNCSRDWNLTYVDTRADIAFTSIVVDWFNPNALYASTSNGDVFKSENQGAAWRRVYRVDDRKITGLVIDPRDSRTIYAGTDGSGVLKTTDAGTTWDKIYTPFKDYDYSARVRALAVDPNQAGRLYTISKYGILRSDDAGVTWKPLTLLTKPGAVDIKAIVVHPKNSSMIAYATDANIVFSTDGGTTWTPKKLPTARGVATMMIDNSPTPNVYIGAMPAK